MYVSLSLSLSLSVCMYVLCMYVCVGVCGGGVCSNIFSETTGPIEANFHVEPGTGEECLFKWSRSFVVLHYCQPPGGRSLSAGSLP